MAFPVSPGFSENPSAVQAVLAVFHHRVLPGSLIKNFSRAIEINMKFIFAAEFPGMLNEEGELRAHLQTHPTCTPGGNGNLPLEKTSPGAHSRYSTADYFVGNHLALRRVGGSAGTSCSPQGTAQLLCHATHLLGSFSGFSPP